MIAGSGIESAMGSEILAAQDVTVRFGGITALSQVSIDVPERTIVGLVGPNGAGKSTLFDVLSGLRRANSGHVFLRGTDISDVSPQRRARRGLGRTFQHPRLFNGVPVRDHLVLAYRLRHARSRLWGDLLSLRLRGPVDRREDELVDGLLAALGIEELAEQLVGGLPLGLSRLVELGRALATGPCVLLLDEPSSGLSQLEVQRLVDVLTRVPRDFGASVLIVEHDVEMVLSLSSSIYVLDFGVVIASGTPQEIRDNETVKAAYLGTATVLVDPAS